MMALVWLIDVLVIVVKILGGRMKVDPVLRFGLWVAVLSLLAAGCVVLVALVVLLQRWLEGLA
ncbi:hypothetical protein IU479_19025 [Nocardia abscessus]|uniref:hypothetical protein n=1 Tax=Nocardia TaxID=1817 RepID=UPI001894A789|nr:MULTISPECIES: hypothetical protein [Nocardia]MBF6220201.1 hypothetical protein [Nocardia abscessus]MDE1670874.1 hypothetical protein [Nocardia gipuzkoensis]